MRQYKIIARILLILPIINFTMALPMAVQETRQACGDAIPAITMSAKRGNKMEKQYFESLSRKPESSSAAHRLSGSARSKSESDDGPINALPQSPAPQMDTSEVPQELPKSPSLNHYLPVDSESDSYQSRYQSYRSPATLESESVSSLTSSLTEEPKSKSFLSKVLSKFNFCCSTTKPPKPRAVWEPDYNSAAEKPPPKHTYDHHTT
ncbi:hypothetical protein F5888DRAFT_1635071 [Russula emetica]|nr:hypothetical protein F5888DRAFT_1635071 [Russula emetica]